jgi:hypothetical protein
MKTLIDTITFAGVKFEHYEVDSPHLSPEPFSVFTFNNGSEHKPYYRSVAYIPGFFFIDGFDSAWSVGDTKEDACYKALEHLMSWSDDDELRTIQKEFWS